MTERLQKLLAGAGHGSRRGIEEWIRAGRVTINDRVAALGDRAASTDRICLDGKPLDLGGRRETVEVLLYHKPVGEMTTRIFMQIPSQLIPYPNHYISTQISSL
jgi:23S rRNA pseudouridine2605 synthase